MRPKCLPFSLLIAAVLLVLIPLGCRRADAGGFPEYAPAGPSESNAALVRRAQLLWRITPRDPAANHALRFLRSLTERLDDNSWWAASAPAFSAWSRLRQNPDVAETVDALTPQLVARVAVAGGADELTELTRMAGSSARDAAAISDTLTTLVGKPLPSAGFSGSMHERMISASIMAGDFARARRFLDAMPKIDAATPELPGESGRLKAALQQCCPSGSPRLDDLPSFIRIWQSFPEETLSGRTLRRSLEEAALALLPFDPMPVRASAVAGLIQKTDSEPAARSFWTSALSRSWRRPPNLRIGALELLQLARLRAALASFYHLPDLEPAFWQSPATLKKEEASRLVTRYVGLAELAAAHEEYEIASEIVRAARPVALASEESSLMMEIQQKEQTTYPGFQRRFEEALVARQTLAGTPEDPAANLLLGRYLCDIRGEWDAGLPFLLKGPDPALRDVAQRDLRHPDSASEESSLGRAWGEYSRVQGAALLERAPERAVHWYERALKRATGTDRSSILEALRRMPPDRHFRGLLDRVNPREDVVYGRWVSDAAGLVSDAAEFARFEIPHHLPPEYDFRITFTRQEGDGDVVVVLPGPDRPFCWVLSGAGQNCRTWASIKGQWDAGDNPTRAFIPGALENDRPATALFEVRKDRIRLFLDGRRIKDWSASYKDLELPEWLALRDPKCPGVATYKSPTRVERIEVLEVGSRGTPAR